MNIITLYADAGRLACRNALQFHCNKLAMQILQISCVCINQFDDMYYECEIVVVVLMVAAEMQKNTNF